MRIFDVEFTRTPAERLADLPPGVDYVVMGVVPVPLYKNHDGTFSLSGTVKNGVYFGDTHKKPIEPRPVFTKPGKPFKRQTDLEAHTEKVFG